MLGDLIESLSNPKVACDLVAALGDPEFAKRLASVAAAQGRSPSDFVAASVCGFLDNACDDHWLQLIGIMSRAEDPGLAAMRAILAKALAEPGA